MSFCICVINKADLLGKGGGMLEDTEIPGILPKKQKLSTKVHRIHYS